MRHITSATWVIHSLPPGLMATGRKYRLKHSEGHWTFKLWCKWSRSPLQWAPASSWASSPFFQIDKSYVSEFSTWSDLHPDFLQARYETTKSPLFQSRYIEYCHKCNYCTVQDIQVRNQLETGKTEYEWLCSHAATAALCATTPVCRSQVALLRDLRLPNGFLIRMSIHPVLSYFIPASYPDSFIWRGY